MKEVMSMEQFNQRLERLEVFMKKIEKLAEDFEFARRTEEAYQTIEAGEGIRMDLDDFLKEMDKW